MRMDLIQPFVNSLDSVMAQIMGCSAQVYDVTMDDESNRFGIASRVCISGEIEGRIILDMDGIAAKQAASYLSGQETDAPPEALNEAVCELTNMVIGNAVTQLNDRGFKFKVHPPEIHSTKEGLQGSVDTEALALRFETPHGAIQLNIAMKHNLMQVSEPAMR